MKYCSECGKELILKKDNENKDIPYCEACNKFYYPNFNIAISAIVKYLDKILLIKQYGKNRNILVAGYVEKTESLEEALIREIKEEVNLDCIRFYFNKSKYYEKSNTLIVNFVVECEGVIKPNSEVDSYNLFNVEDVITNIAPNSLAKHFFETALLKKMV